MYELYHWKQQNGDTVTLMFVLFVLARWFSPIILKWSRLSLWHLRTAFMSMTDWLTFCSITGGKYAVWPTKKVMINTKFLSNITWWKRKIVANKRGLSKTNFNMTRSEISTRRLTVAIVFGSSWTSLPWRGNQDWVRAFAKINKQRHKKMYLQHWPEIPLRLC